MGDTRKLDLAECQPPNNELERARDGQSGFRDTSAARRSTRALSVSVEMSQVSDNLRILERLAEAFNEHDLDRIMEFFAEDCSLDMPRGSAAWGTRYVGKAAVREGLQTRFEMLPDVHYGDVRHFATEKMGVSEWLVTGTLRSGETIAARGCDHYEFREGKVVRKDSYWKIVE